MELENKHIVIVSNEPWGNTWYSKHNYAWELAKKNKVIFVNPVNKWKFRLNQSNIIEEKITDNLSVITYHNSIPSLNKLCYTINNSLVSKRLNKYFKSKGFSDFIFWTFDPYRLYQPKQLGAKTSIFHAVDKYIFNHWGEELTCKYTQKFILVSKELKSTFQAYQQPKLILEHAISSEEFTYGDRPDDLPNGDYALYVGNIDLRLDYGQIEELVKDHPELNFVFLGNQFYDDNNESAVRLFKKKKYANVYAPGSRNFKLLKHYIGHSKFCFALMVDTFNGNRIAHHKIFQYMALGKPVFSSVFTDYLPVSHLLYMHDDLSELKQKLTTFLTKGEPQELKTEREKYAAKHTFENALNRIGEFLN